MFCSAQTQHSRCSASHSAVRSNQRPDSFLTIIIHLGFVIRAASSSGGRMEGTGCSVPRVCWAEPELRCPWPGPGQAAGGWWGISCTPHHTVATSSWPERVTRPPGGRGDASGGLYVAINPLAMTRLFSPNITSHHRCPLIALVRYPGGLRNVE